MPPKTSKINGTHTASVSVLLCYCVLCCFFRSCFFVASQAHKKLAHSHTAERLYILKIVHTTPRETMHHQIPHMYARCVVFSSVNIMYTYQRYWIIGGLPPFTTVGSTSVFWPGSRMVSLRFSIRDDVNAVCVCVSVHARSDSGTMYGGGAATTKRVSGRGDSQHRHRRNQHSSSNYTATHTHTRTLFEPGNGKTNARSR